MSKIICDQCQKEIDNIFEGDEYKGQFLCLDCLKKSEYHIFHNIKVIQTMEITNHLDYDFELTEVLIRITDVEINCGICENSWRIPKEEIDEKVKEHFEFHKKQMEIEQASKYVKKVKKDF